ncbi:MAG: hypothetical protein J5770_05065 [Bacteroidaceae bacterium]|nr:hypothetical protein [Bacteroidaceae bacterium]
MALKGFEGKLKGIEGTILCRWQIIRPFNFLSILFPSFLFLSAYLAKVALINKTEGPLPKKQTSLN